MRVNQITAKIIHVEMPDQASLAKTFLRFQEYYEGPKFADTIFTLGLYRKWYAEKYGAFTYYKDWNGFNIPNTALQPFIQGLFDPLTEGEQSIVDLFKDRQDIYYLIGTPKDNEEGVLSHEITHGIYHIDADYKKVVNTILDAVPSNESKTLKAFRAYLEKIGYHKKVLDDEVNAYLSNNNDWVFEKGFNLPQITKELIRLRKRVFREHKIEEST